MDIFLIDFVVQRVFQHFFFFIAERMLAFPVQNPLAITAGVISVVNIGEDIAVAQIIQDRHGEAQFAIGKVKGIIMHNGHMVQIGLLSLTQFLYILL